MKPASIKDERLRRAFATPAERAEPGTSCPPDERIWDAAHGALDPQRIQEVLDHTAGCVACQESWRAARAIGPGSVEPGRAVSPTTRPVRRWRVWAGMGVAAAAAAVAFLVPLTPSSPPAPGSRFRGADVPRIESLVDERKPLPRAAFLLRWKVGHPGEIYTIEVAREDLTVIARAQELEVGEFRVAPAALEGLPSGTALLWRVEALLPDTSRVSSPVFRVVLE